jgi:hypothetical protein
MNQNQPPLLFELEKGFNEIVISTYASGARLSEDAHLMLDHIAGDGLGITDLKRSGESTYIIEHKPDFSGTDIVRYFGYLAMGDLGRDVQFMRPDGQPHAIQLDNSQAD